ncbi:MAG TPA: c-type cytochrome [Candidatus Binatia bacterium]|nr:c-type cytochrome [Candidatus Binatia bacterium]
MTAHRAAVFLGLALGACARTGPPAAATPELVQLYNQTCRACHTEPASGAPQAGDRRAWEARLAQGSAVLLEHTIDGYRGMPPLGSCMDCGEKEFRQLIELMSGSRLE